MIAYNQKEVDLTYTPDLLFPPPSTSAVVLRKATRRHGSLVRVSQLLTQKERRYLQPPFPPSDSLQTVHLRLLSRMAMAVVERSVAAMRNGHGTAKSRIDTCLVL